MAAPSPSNEELSRIYRRLFEASHDVLVVTDESARIVDINPRGAEITGYTSQELLGMDAPRELVAAEDSERLACMLAEVRAGQVRRYEVRWKAKDGRVIEFDVISVPIFLPGRKIAWSSCTLRDVSERKAIERELRESSKRLQQIVATLPVGLAVTDLAGDFVLANESLKRIWGDAVSSGAERLSRGRGYWHDTGKSIAPSEWASARAISQGETSLGELLDIVTFDGQEKTIQNSVAPLRSEDGAIVGAIVVNEDVTDRVRAEVELRGALEELKALSRKLVEVQETERRELSRELHDRIGQNLTALGVNLEIVKTRLAKKVPDVASRLKDSRDLLEATFDAMIDLLSELRPPMLDDMGLAAALKWHARQFSERTGLEVSVDAGSGIHRLDAESDLVLFRIAQEALNNVAKHANAHHVHVALTPSDRERVLSISDDGVGVDTDADGMLRARSGLGIVTMRERTHAIGGSLEVRRRAEGGTSVIVRVPST